MANVTPEMVQKAYDALGTLDDKVMSQYWDENMVWLVPGHNPLSGWYHGRQAFINFMKTRRRTFRRQLPHDADFRDDQRRLFHRRDQ